jgi:hypothetical protein
MVELLFLLSLLAVRRMLREHTRAMSKNADDGHSLEGLSTLHPCFIDMFAVCFLKRCVQFITGHFCLSSVVSSIPLSTWHLTKEIHCQICLMIFAKISIFPRDAQRDKLK